MGDGQHAWAAAEWILMMRSLFLREEPEALIVGSGMPEEWFEKADRLAYGPTATRSGPVAINLVKDSARWHLTVDARWFGRPPEVRVNIPGFIPETIADFSSPLELQPRSILKS